MSNDCLMLKAAQQLVNPGPGMDGPDSSADDDLEVTCPQADGRRRPADSTVALKMSLHINNEDTCRLVAELAALTGETMTGAITVALQERLERETRARSIEVRVRDQLADEPEQGGSQVFDGSARRQGKGGVIGIAVSDGQWQSRLGRNAALENIPTLPR